MEMNDIEKDFFYGLLKIILHHWCIFDRIIGLHIIV